MTPLTVLHLATNRWWTGSADPTLQLLGALRERGHRVLLAAIPGDRFETKARERGFDLVPGIRLRARLAPLAFVQDLRRLRAVAREEGLDLVHAHHSHDHWLAAGALGVGRRRLPVARTFHNFRAVRRDRFARCLYRQTAVAFAVSRQIEGRCLEVGFAADRVCWLPGSADLGRFSLDADGRSIRREFDLGTAPVIVSVARLAPGRGHELLIEGFRRLLTRRPDARLLLVGKGERQARLARLIAELGLQGQVHLVGYRDRDLRQVLAAADCFALMGLGSDESCRAVLEAMAAGRAVVARRMGGLPETILHGVTGFLVEDDRPEGLAEALASVLADPELARRMGAAGQRRVREDFSPERTATVTETAYRRCVSSS